MNSCSLTLLVIVLPVRPLEPPGLEGIDKQNPNSAFDRMRKSLGKRARNWGIGVAIALTLAVALWATGVLESVSIATSVHANIASRCNTATNNVSIRREIELR